MLKAFDNKVRENGDALVRFAALIMRHPFIAAAVVCLLSLTVTTEEAGGLCFIIPALLFGFCCMTGISYAARDAEVRDVITGRVLALVLTVMFCGLMSRGESPRLVLLFYGLGLAVFAFIYLFASGHLDGRKAAMLFIISGFLMRLVYIMSFTINKMQHDVGSIEKMKGHVGYIAYFLENRHLPDFDPTKVYQFYHPPLHHIISAVWVRLQTFIGISSESAFENVQILTLFYSVCCMVICYKLFRKLGLDGKGLACAAAVISFCPIFFILGGSINNDILSLTLLLAAFLNTLCWFEKRSFFRLMCIAVCVGCSMMTKLSGWMAAPAIAFIFIFVFFSERGKKLIRAGQYVVFLAVCAPLGLWWEIRNNIEFDVPITYVLKLSKKSDQYIGDIPVMERLFDFSFFQFENAGEQFKRFYADYNEYNPLIGLFKSSDFDELFTVRLFPTVEGFDKLLLWTTIILGIVSFAAMIYVFIADRELSWVYKIFMGIIYITFIVSYYAFCIGFPHVCTQNIRYAVPLIVVGAFFFGRMVQLLEKKSRLPFKAASFGMCVIPAAYCAASAVFYGIVFYNVNV